MSQNLLRNGRTPPKKKIQKHYSFCILNPPPPRGCVKNDYLMYVCNFRYRYAKYICQQSLHTILAIFYVDMSLWQYATYFYVCFEYFFFWYLHIYIYIYYISFVLYLLWIILLFFGSELLVNDRCPRVSGTEKIKYEKQKNFRKRQFINVSLWWNNSKC